MSCCLGIWSSIIKSTEPSPLSTSSVPAVKDKLWVEELNKKYECEGFQSCSI